LVWIIQNEAELLITTRFNKSVFIIFVGSVVLANTTHSHYIRVARFFLGTTHQNGKNIRQITIKWYMKHDPSKFTQIGISGLKIGMPSGNPALCR
jgi:hypothetical protein